MDVETGEDIHMDITMNEEATVEGVQRIIDQKCRELTVMPLANVSDAYSVYSESVAGSRAGSVFYAASEADA